MISWSVELLEYNIQYVMRGSIKSHALADFVVELNSPVEEEPPLEWALSVDNAYNVKGRGARIMLEGLRDIFFENALKFEFIASKNQMEYEALMFSMVLAREIGVARLKAKSDSHLVPNQVSGQYQAKEHMLIKYMKKVPHLSSCLIFSK